jgi:hypothetical protein
VRRGLALAGLLALASPAAASSYCEGRLVLERFEVRGTPGPMGRTNYTAHLRNTHSGSLRVVVLLTGDALGRPRGQPRAMRAGTRAAFALGYHPKRPGAPPMKADRLAGAMRVSCR